MKNLVKNFNNGQFDDNKFTNKKKMSSRMNVKKTKKYNDWKFIEWS